MKKRKFGTEISELRRLKNISQTEFEEMLDINVSALSILFVLTFFTTFHIENITKFKNLWKDTLKSKKAAKADIINF